MKIKLIKDLLVEAKLSNSLSLLDKKLKQEFSATNFKYELSNNSITISHYDNILATIYLIISNNNLEIALNDINNNSIAIDSNLAKIPIEDLNQDLADKIVTVLYSNLTKIEDLKEASSLLTKISNAIFNKKSNNNTIDLKSINNLFETSINNILKAQNKSILVKTNIKDNNIVIKILNEFYVKANIIEDLNNILVKSSTTCTGEVINYNKPISISKFFEKINSILDLHINVKSNNIDNDSSADTIKDDKFSSYKDSLLAKIGSKASNIFGSNFLHEQKNLGSKYAATWSAIDSKDTSAKIAFIKLFMLEEADLTSPNSIDDLTALELLKCALNSNPSGFNLNLNLNLAAVVNFAKIHENVKFTTSSKDSNIIYLMNSIPGSSLQYSINLTTNTPTVADFEKLLAAPYYLKTFLYYYSIDDAKRFISKYNKIITSNIDYKELNKNQKLHKALQLNSAVKLSKNNLISYIFIQKNNLVQRQTFRPISEIEALTNIVLTNNSEESSKEDSSSQAEEQKFRLTNQQLKLFLDDIITTNYLDVKYFDKLHNYLKNSDNKYILKKFASAIKTNLDNILK